ncbi:ribonuclease P protein subunit p29 [Trichonephila inaurata madagascariensis]|uniref:Ribonuclease P protein subunit p29 n=1 Tax=Trichonephila inaurata madagascariensis TaxID=2747483 RepID=A0A8X6YHA9_9ARAC|nr:ribonuclease P protein subunit p29 [Trichonephila inaurata madagascariensis]
MNGLACFTAEDSIINPELYFLSKNLPPSIEKLSERIGLRKVPDDYIKGFLKKTVPNPLNEFKEYIFGIKKFKKRRNRMKRKKCKTLFNASEQRRLGILKIDPQSTKFQTFIPIHELWKQYMQKMLQLKEPLPHDLSGIYQKLSKADYHGCFLVVVSSACHNYVGSKGIVIQETKNVFRLITEENKIKTIPKKRSVFCFELNGNIFKIYGDNFCFVPYERIRVKFKTRNLVNP